MAPRLLPELFFALPQLAEAGVLQGFVDLRQFPLNIGGQWPFERGRLLQRFPRSTKVVRGNQFVCDGQRIALLHFEWISLDGRWYWRLDRSGRRDRWGGF